MANRFASAISRGLQRAESYAGESVTYSRGSASVGITAIRGDKSATEQELGEETSVLGTRVDWIILREHVEQTAGPIAPRLGDTITDAKGVVYVVTDHPADGKPARWTEHRLALRIHTLVGSGEQ